MSKTTNTKRQKAYMAINTNPQEQLNQQLENFIAELDQREAEFKQRKAEPQIAGLIKQATETVKDFSREIFNYLTDDLISPEELIKKIADTKINLDNQLKAYDQYFIENMPVKSDSDSDSDSDGNESETMGDVVDNDN